jgi:internalin A
VLEKNQLHVFPTEICKLSSLTELHLGFNSIKTLPPEIERLSALITLHLHNNVIEKINKGTAVITLD